MSNDDFLVKTGATFGGLGLAGYGVKQLFEHSLFGTPKKQIDGFNVNNLSTRNFGNYSESKATLKDEIFSLFKNLFKRNYDGANTNIRKVNRVIEQLEVLKQNNNEYFHSFFKSPKVWVGLAAIVTGAEIISRTIFEKSLIPFLNKKEQE